MQVAEGTESKPLRTVLELWLDRLEAQNLLMDRRDQLEPQFSRWLDMMDDILQGESSTEAELYRLLAFYGRNRGLEGRPASAILSQAFVLEAVVEESFGPQREFQALLRRVSPVLVDAHALGHSERLRQRHLKELRSCSPVFRIQNRVVVGFLLGPMEADSIDALIGRILTECACSNTDTAIIDVLGAEPDEDTFHRTLLGFTTGEDPPWISLIVTGLKDVARTREALTQLRCPEGRVRLEADLGPILENMLKPRDPDGTTDVR